MTGSAIQTCRSLLRTYWYSLTVIALVALCAGLAGTVFAVVDGVLFRPLPYPHANRLYRVLPGFTGISPESPHAVGFGHIADWNAADSNIQLTGFRTQPSQGYGSGVNDDAAGVALVQANFFEVIGVRPMIGGFSADDFIPEQPIQPVVIQYEVWQGRFLGDRGIIGRVIEIDPVRHTGFRIVGIMPQGFTFPSARTDVRYIAPFIPARDQADPYLRQLSDVIARIPESMTVKELEARVAAGIQASATQTPPQGAKPSGWSDRGWRMQGPFDRADVLMLRAALEQQSGGLFRGVFAAAVLLFAIGALNVSALMAARWLDRNRELGVRRALGATATSICGLVVAETLTLVCIGAAMGLGLASAFLRLTLSLLPEDMVLLKPAEIDWRVIGFLAMGSLVVACSTSIWPIWRALRVGGWIVSDAGRATSLRSLAHRMVVMSQVAGAFVLTILGALVVSSLLMVYANDRPIRTHGVLAIGTRLMGQGGNTMARLDPIIERLRRVSGVRAVAATSAQLLAGSTGSSLFTPPKGAAADRRLDVYFQGVTEDYFQVLEPQLITGRTPTPAELRANEPLIVVSERLARSYWPSAAAVGEIIGRSRDMRRYTVVGVVRDVPWSSWDTEVAAIYAPYDLVSRFSYATFLVRTDGQTGRVMADALDAVRDADPFAQSSSAATLDALFRDSVRTRRFRSWVFGSFSAAALAVVGVGILGLMAMSTARRTKEIGIRCALGSTRQGVIRLIIMEQSAAVAAGLVVGGVVSAWAVTLVKSYLYGVTSSAPGVWVLAGGLIIAATVLGAIVPAWRASRTDPVQALRVD
jgi:predicted permease